MNEMTNFTFGVNTGLNQLVDHVMDIDDGCKGEVVCLFPTPNFDWPRMTGFLLFIWRPDTEEGEIVLTMVNRLNTRKALGKKMVDKTIRTANELCLIRFFVKCTEESYEFWTKKIKLSHYLSLP